MTETDITLAREAVACKHWAWMPGMRMVDAANCFAPCRVVTPSEGVRVTTTSHRLYRPATDAQDVPSWPDWLPDLADDATRGALLALARKAWNCDDYRRLTIEPAGAGFCVVVRNGRHRPPSRAQPGWDLDRVAHPPYRNSQRVLLDEYPTEAAALVAALKAAP